ncbi:hypothetical protein IJI69_04555 [Candidatus Saccharibacteria bacterium]|nr:hypothetical protein [Candidatus Saccharibacteria bacterium]
MRRKIIIFVVAVVAGLVNAAVIFNIIHRNDYVDEIISVTRAMSETTKDFVVDNDTDYENFSARARADGFSVYKMDNLPDSTETVWLVFTQNSQRSEDPLNGLMSKYRQVSEVIKNQYSVFELEKL